MVCLLARLLLLGRRRRVRRVHPSWGLSEGPLPPTDGQENLKDCLFGGGGVETPLHRKCLSLSLSLSLCQSPE